MKKTFLLGVVGILLLNSCRQQPCNCPPEPDVKPVSAAVSPHLGRPAIFINNNPQVPMLYALPDVPGGRWSWEELPQHNIRQFCEQGIKLYQVDLFLEHLWPGPDSFDIRLVKRQVRGVLQACPGAAVFFRFHVNAPRWWVESHPEENTIYDEGEGSPDLIIGLSRILEADPRDPVRPSLASEAWLEASSEKLQQFLEIFAQTEEGNALAGIQVACGVYGEWHYWGFLNHTPDVSLPMTRYFREWLRNKYQTNEKLQKSWANPSITFETAGVPRKKERSTASAGVFRDPVTDRNVIDYFQCQHELVADDIIRFCRVVKENWPRPIITGTFYGYFFSVFGRQATGGHLALHRVLQSEYVDYLSGPQVYYPDDGYRDGEPYRSRSLIHSLTLNGKLWLDEYDQQPRRTWPWLPGGDNRDSFRFNILSNIAQIRRNTLFSLTKGHGLWLYDFGIAAMHLHPNNEINKQSGTTGYWDNPDYMQNIGTIREIAEDRLKVSYRSDADVLLVYDTEAIMHLGTEELEKCAITEHVVNWTSLGLYYAGVVFDPVHLDDLEKVNLDQYRVVIFGNTFLLDDEEKDFIKNQVLNDDRHVIWIYAPGYSNDRSISLEHVSEISGFGLKIIPSSDTAAIEVEASLGDFPMQKARSIYEPLIAIEDERALIYGNFVHNGQPAFGKKELAGYTSWYIGIPPEDSDLIREIMRQGNVHVYTDTRDIIYSGNGLLVFHTKDGGKKEVVLKNERVVEMELSLGPQTVVLDSESGEIILE